MDPLRNKFLRFTDVNQEKGVLLNIIDICDVSLTSLQESCQILESFVPAIQDHVNASYMWAESIDSLPNGTTIETAAGKTDIYFFSRLSRVFF